MSQIIPIKYIKLDQIFRYYGQKGSAMKIIWCC